LIIEQNKSIIYIRQEVIRLDENQYIITFNSTHHALAFEKEAKDNNMKITILPVPRNIAASCGLAIMFDKGDLENIKTLIKEKSLNYSGIYIVKNDKGKKDYIKIEKSF